MDLPELEFISGHELCTFVILTVQDYQLTVVQCVFYLQMPSFQWRFTFVQTPIAQTVLSNQVIDGFFTKLVGWDDQENSLCFYWGLLMFA